MPSRLPGIPKADAENITPEQRTAQLLRRVVIQFIGKQGLPPVKETRRVIQDMADRCRADYEEMFAIYEDVVPQVVENMIESAKPKPSRKPRISE